MAEKKVRAFLKENRLLLSIIVGVIVGCIIGVSSHGAVQSSQSPTPTRLVMYMKFPGELFIRMLKMIVVPLIVCSIIVALVGIDISSASRLGKRTMVYYLSTSVFSSILGLVLAATMKPGSSVSEAEEASTKKTHRNSVDNFLDLLRNAFPDNLVQAFFKSVYTTYKETRDDYRFETKNVSQLSNMTAARLAKFLQDNTVVPRLLSNSSRDHEVAIITNDVTYDFGGLQIGGGTNMIGLIVFSIAFGVVLNMMKEEGTPLVNVFKSMWSATMKLVEIMMWAAPVGIASVIAGNIVETKDVSALFRAMGMYVLVNVVGYIVQAGLLYPTLYFIFFRRSPLRHLKGVMPALMTALGTSSSAATLPTTIECCETKVKMDERVTRFVLPIGATCNMDGTALCFAIIVLFIEQIEPGVNLTIAEIILTVFVCTVISVGAAGIPSPGLTNTLIVLETVGLPIGKMGPLFATDWIVDRLQTTINVMGDTYAAAFIEKMSRQELLGSNEATSEVIGNSSPHKTTDTSLPLSRLVPREDIEKTNSTRL